MKTYQAGIDVGSTTVKLVVLDENGQMIFGQYQRHLSHTQRALSDLLKQARAALGECALELRATGSGAINLAKALGIPEEMIRLLNPQYKQGIIPATTKPYTLVLPQRYVMQYIAHEPEIQAKDSMYLKEYINPANIDKKRQERSGSVYVVKKGDTLGAIARRYRVTTAQIMRWNKLKSAHKLRIGQRLRIEGR